jgi:tetratricopeptide (TPR) repeat protein
MIFSPKFHLPIIILFMIQLLLTGCSPNEPLPPVSKLRPETIIDSLQKEMISKFESLALRSPDNAISRGKYAFALFENGAFQESSDEFKAAALLDKNNPLWDYRAARSIAMLGNIESANEKLVKLCNNFPDYLPARHYLATSLLDSGNIEKAREQINQCLALSPSSFPLKTTLAEISLESGQPEIALEILTEITNSDRQNPYPFYLLGKTYLILQIVATSDIENILRNSLDSERVILKDKTERSMKGLKTGLQVEVNNCLFSLQRKNWNQATVSIQKAYKRFPNDFQVLGLFAQCLHINGRTNEAFTLIQKIPLTFRNNQINLLLDNIRKKLNG